MKTLPMLVCLLAALTPAAFPLAAHADSEKQSQPATAPSTRPADSIDALVKQLGDENFHVRRDATRKLREIGKPALEALKQARKSPDLDLQSRADQLVREIERPVDDSPVPQPTGRGRYSTTSSTINGHRTIEVNEIGRTIHIDEMPGSLTMVITGSIDGKEVTRHYQAQNADQLKSEHPAAYELYKQIALNDVHKFGMIGQVNIQFHRVQINGNGPIIAPMGNEGEAAFIFMRMQLSATMTINHVPADEQARVLALVDQLRDARPEPNAAAQDEQAIKRVYANRRDALARKLAELKLDDAGIVLPAP